MSRRRDKRSKKVEVSIPQPTRSFGDPLNLGVESFTESFSQLSTTSGDSDSKIKFAEKKYGTAGQKTQLLVNFFKIDIAQRTADYFHYNIEIIKEDKEGANTSKDPKNKKSPKRLNDDVFKEIFNKHKNIFQCRTIPAFDGEKNFYSTTRFNLPNNSWTGIVEVKDKDKIEKIRVNITVPEISHIQNLNNLLKKSESIMPVELQALDIIMRNGPRLKKISLGSNLFFKNSDPQARGLQFDIGIPRGRDIIPDAVIYGQFGHYQCARKCETGLYYNVDRAMAIFSNGGKLFDLICDILGTDSITMDKEDREYVKEKITGLKFSALHLNYKRTFIIQGLSKTSCRDTTFSINKDGKKLEISVFNYFKQEYKQFCNKYPLDPNLPCVQVGREPNLKNFPIECCLLEDDEVYRRKLTKPLQGMVTRKSSQQTPIDRFKNIENHLRAIDEDCTINGTNYLKHFGISINNKNPTRIDARIIDAPPIEYKDRKLKYTQNEGSWDMKDFLFYNPSDIGSNWAVVNIHRLFGKENRSSIRKPVIESLIKSLIRESKFKGMNLSYPNKTFYEFDYKGRGTLQQTLFKNLDRNCRFVIIIIPTKDEIYNEIKTIAELELGLITQCLNQDQKYFREDYFSSQLLTNILLKINPKCNGTNVNIPRENRAQILTTKLMIVGLDVTHPSPSDGLKKSVAACVASYTKELDKVFHRLLVQEKARKEVVNLKEIMKELLQNFRNFNNFYPTRIIIYRDGVGEGDFEKIITIEKDSIKKACQELGQDIKLTYIMVQKRHNTRFLPANARATDRRQNIKPGTVVDTQIVHFKFFEFYLCSHAGMMGTSRPTKYVVLHDENQLSADEIQKATYQLCYLFPRCTKSSSIPPHVNYSHLLCKRGRSYLASIDGTDGKPSSGPIKVEELTLAKVNEYNQKLTVKKDLNGRLFFI